MKLLTTLLSLLMMLTLTTCSDDSAGDLTFVGDSLVDGWNTDYWFPGRHTVNDGVSGARIEYIESLAGRYTGRDLVVLIGTNNYFMLTTDDDRRAYADRYLDAVRALGARHIILLSLLPREYVNGRDVNPDLRAFNALIHTAVVGDPVITYLDVHNLYLDGDTINRTLYNPGDGLHIGEKGYALLSSAVKQCLKFTIDRQ